MTITFDITEDEAKKLLNQNTTNQFQDLNIEKLEKELAQLYFWFEEYDSQIHQFHRCLRLGIEFDKDVKELDKQAVINQERIKIIKNILKIKKP